MFLNVAGNISYARLAVVATALLGGAIRAFATSPADTIAARQANFKQIGKGTKAIGDQIKSPTDLAEIKSGAAAIEQASGKVYDYFPKGTGPETKVKTGALSAIWDKNAEFKDDAANLVKAAAALRMAADSGNVDQVKVQFMAVGGTCKDCHQAFRAKED